jgi:hypothetical protein
MDHYELVKKLHEIARILNPSEISPNPPKREQVTERDVINWIDYIRVCVKYNGLDLDATRRDNSDLRRSLEERSK